MGSIIFALQHEKLLGLFFSIWTHPHLASTVTLSQSLNPAASFSDSHHQVLCDLNPWVCRQNSSTTPTSIQKIIKGKKVSSNLWVIGGVKPIVNYIFLQLISNVLNIRQSTKTSSHDATADSSISAISKRRTAGDTNLAPLRSHIKRIAWPDKWV